MKILIVDRTSEGQAAVAGLVQSFDAADLETLDVTVHLSSSIDCRERVVGCDVLLLGPGLGVEARSLINSAKEVNPAVEIILFVSEFAYADGAYRMADRTRIRKVIADNASPLDLLQEIVSIHKQLRVSGKVRDGQVIAVVHAKGGVGATSICAALGEVCEEAGRTALLWDLDVESRDLSRSMAVPYGNGHVVTAWIRGEISPTRQTLRDALVSIGRHVDLLTPPNTVVAGASLVGQPEGAEIVDRVVNLARVTFDNLIVDCGSRMGPAAALLINSADIVLVVAEDSTLGLTAVPAFLTGLQSLQFGFENLRVLCSGTRSSLKSMTAVIDTEVRLPEQCWSLPAIPYDKNAELWPASGKTLYSVGQKATRAAFAELACQIGLLQSRTKFVEFPVVGQAAAWSQAVGAEH